VIEYNGELKINNSLLAGPLGSVSESQYGHAHDLGQTRRVTGEPAVRRLRGGFRSRGGLRIARFIDERAEPGRIRRAAVRRLLFEVVARHDGCAPSRMTGRTLNSPQFTVGPEQKTGFRG
jgi:hypothetical protein